MTLPKSRTTETRPPSSLIITVERGGGLALAGQPVTLTDLPSVLGAALARASDRGVVIQSDTGVPFGRVVEVMEAARDGGAQDISFLVERTEKP